MNRRLTTRALAALALAAPAALAQPTGAPAQPATDRAAPSLTLEQITAEPDWIARSPQRPQWLVDGSAIRFSQRRPDLVGRDFNDDSLIFLNHPDAEPVKITPENPGPFLTARGDWDAAHTRRLVPHNGDLFLYNAADGSITQLTRTGDYESSASFMADDTRIAFTRGGDWYIRSESAAGPVELQAADIQFRDEPKDPAAERQKEADKRDDLQNEQRELFDIINLEDQRDAMRDDDRAAWRDADPTSVPGPFYLGDDKRSQGSWLSPSGNFLLLATTPKKTPDDKNDVLADYINEDGYVQTRPVRTKAGLEHRTPVSFVLLDLEHERVIDLPLDDLPTITDDPLAWLKDKAETDEPAADAPAADEPEQDEQSDTEEKKKEDEHPTPRPVSSLGVRWSDSGRYAAVMLRSNDNKDRWIAMIDTAADEPKLTSAHHLRDEAWINWSFNEFGSVPHSDTLWYLSEETNYSHLYTYDPATDTTSQETEGDFEVRDISFTHDGTRVYMRTNRTHPGIEKLERLDLSTGTLTPITTMSGSIENYALAPDETQAVVTYSNIDSPPELYLLDLTTPGAAPNRLTHTITDAFAALPLTETQIIPIPSSHTEQPIYTRVLLPDPQQFPGPRPLIVFAHGAGYLQNANHEWSYYFREHLFHSLLTSEGFIVIAPDFRASEGYGRDWRTAIYRDMGRPELEDFQDCIDWAVQSHNADPQRVGIYGGSYGGFLTLMAMFTQPDTYAAGAALRSVTDWRHYNHGYTVNILNTPDIDPEAYNRSSPINHAEGLKGHLLMLHGLVDDNVVAQDIIRLSQRLIELEKQDWTLALAPVESHAYEEPSSWLDQMRRIHKLFTEELNGD